MTGSVIEKIFLEDLPLLDVRAPCEFKKGAFPNAVNLPLLNDQQREEVGICYKQHGQEKAIELGNHLITPASRQSKIAAWANFVELHPIGFLYCFRGGKRSQFVQQWLKENGIEYPLVQGGYKKMRSYLLEQLELLSKTLPFVLISGKTGSGKTALLPRLPHYVDLEALANHRGSSFGANLTPQPGVISFENSLSIQLLKISKRNPSTIFLEDEGKLIGRLAIPQTLRETMLTLPCVLLSESVETRVEITEKHYISDLLNCYQSQFGTEAGTQLFVDHHKKALHKIRKRFGEDRINKAETIFDNGMTVLSKEGNTSGFRAYLEFLLVNYYDPMYEYQFRSKNRQILFSGTATEIADWCNHRQAHQDFS